MTLIVRVMKFFQHLPFRSDGFDKDSHRLSLPNGIASLPIIFFAAVEELSFTGRKSLHLTQTPTYSAGPLTETELGVRFLIEQETMCP